MSQQPVHVGVGVDLSPGNLIKALAAVLTAALIGVSGLYNQGIINATDMAIAMFWLTLGGTFLGVLTGKNTAPVTNAQDFADMQNELAALQQDYDALKAVGNSVAPQPAPTITGLTLHLSDGNSAEATVT